MTFDECLKITLKREGGYVNDPRDPGGETNLGISRRSYPNEDIAGMTVERAAIIYHRDFWEPAGCEVVPDEVRFHLFDCAVNSGVRQAIKILQRAVGVTDDGIIGPQTLRAVHNTPRLAARYSAARLEFMTGLQGWPTFGKGWARRIAANLMGA